MCILGNFILVVLQEWVQIFSDEKENAPFIKYTAYTYLIDVLQWLNTNNLN